MSGAALRASSLAPATGAAGVGERILGRRRPPVGLLLLGVLIGAAAALPAAYLLVVVLDAPSTAADVLSSRTLGLLGRTLGLAAAVTASAVAIAVPLAWLTTRTDLPARRLWATLIALPLVVPSYVGAYLLTSTFGPRGFLQDVLGPLGVDRIPSIFGFPGAWLALTLFTYPLVLLTVRGALVRLDPQLEEAARAMGRSPMATFRTVVLPQLLPAIAAGSLLVALYVLSDFGAVSIMGFDTFTLDIYMSYQSSFDRTGAATLGAVLVLLMIVLLFVYGRFRRRLSYHRVGPGTQRPTPVIRLGRWRGPALAYCGLVTLLALALPVAVLIYWSSKGLGADPDWGTIATNAGNSLLAAGGAAIIAVLAAIVLSILVVRYPSGISRLLERLGYTGYALPGIVVALALVFFASRVLLPIYQTLGLLIIALGILFVPLAIGATAAALLQVPPRVEEAARGFGRSPIEVFRTITAPLLASGILAGAALVFLHAIKELPATLILAPIGFETLALDIWRQTTIGFFEAGAIPALVLVLVAAPPLYLLSGKGAVAP